MEFTPDAFLLRHAMHFLSGVDSCRGRPPERGSWCSARRATGRSPGPCRFFLSAGAVLVRAHNGPVDHRIFVVGIGREMLEDPLPDSRLRPPAEAPVHVFPIPEAFRQIAPGYPGPIAVEHRFDEPPVVDRGHANPTLAPRKQVPDAVPLIIAKSVAAHRSAPEADRLRIGKPAAPESAICRQRDDCSGSVAFRTQSPQCAELTTRPSVLFEK